MLLKVVDGEIFKDVRIEEGEMFLLPGEVYSHPTLHRSSIHRSVDSKHTAQSCEVRRHDRDRHRSYSPHEVKR